MGRISIVGRKWIFVGKKKCIMPSSDRVRLSRLAGGRLGHKCFDADTRAALEAPQPGGSEHWHATAARLVWKEKLEILAGCTQRQSRLKGSHTIASLNAQ